MQVDDMHPCLVVLHTPIWGLSVRPRRSQPGERSAQCGPIASDEQRRGGGGEDQRQPVDWHVKCH